MISSIFLDSRLSLVMAQQAELRELAMHARLSDTQGMPFRRWPCVRRSWPTKSPALPTWPRAESAAAAGRRWPHERRPDAHRRRHLLIRDRPVASKNPRGLQLKKYGRTQGRRHGP